MALNTSTGPGAMTGARYVESLKDGREVWLDGQTGCRRDYAPGVFRHGA